MDTCNARLSVSYTLNEQVARQVFEVLPEEGPILAILDRDGHCWVSDPETFARLSVAETLLDDLRTQVDDGAEPAMVRVGDATVMATQLRTEETNCGYLILVVRRPLPNMTPTDLDLIEVLLGQLGLVARLIEKYGQLSDIQRKCYHAYGTSHAPVN